MGEVPLYSTSTSQLVCLIQGGNTNMFHCHKNDLSAVVLLVHDTLSFRVVTFIYMYTTSRVVTFIYMYTTALSSPLSLD